MRRGLFVTIVAFLGIVSAGLNGPLARAATIGGSPNGFSISPVLTEITVAKGTSQTIPITVANPTANAIVANPIVNDFVASADETGTPRLVLNSNTPIPANNFKSIVGNVQKTTIPPNQSVIVNVPITVSKDALSGGYYGAIRFIPTISSTGSANVGLTASVGTLFLITVPGNLTSAVSLVQLSAADASGNPSTFFTNGQVSALLRLSVTGNIYAQPFGSIEVKDMFGKIVSVTQFNNRQPRKSILPGSTRKFVQNLPKHNYIGHYTIIASISYGTSGGNLIVSKVTFWYIPVWLQIAILALLVIIIALIYYTIHKVRSRKFRRVR